ncbi:MAG: preprotein translocase subunit SecA [Candidatus Babeliales bacterium]
MLAKLLAAIFGTANERELKKLIPIVEKINKLEPAFEKLSDADLKYKTIEFKERLSRGQSLDDILPEAFAAVREASKRTIDLRHYDVQLIGGIVLHYGKIAEMKTGEGKTLVATLPLYLNALSGKGAQLVTVNDYLARRDTEWMRPIYEALGMTVAVLQNDMNDSERKKAYNSDILYATNNELGFDYLRDNMKFRLEDYVQRDHNYAIVDEVDSILIDEARTPLIISGSSDESSKLYEQADKEVRRLTKNVDYEVDEKARSVHLTESGVDKIEAAFSVANLYAIEQMTLLHHINQALKAHALFRKDVDYVVKDGEVLIVDEFTGRILPGRRYSDGLHQALEAKEGVVIEKESQTLAAITLQNFFRIYKKLAGMTGTAATEAEEFHQIYGLDVAIIPTNKPLIRVDNPDIVFLSRVGKFKAIAKDVQERHQKGQPVLIGTVAIETSELLSDMLRAHGVEHEVLNAKQHAREADIIEHAGQAGRVTIATNMAGRGTDIKLTPESREAGGLYILGTERHESRRIDNQLRGRSGRQGDAGESRFYISLDDDLIRIFAGDSIKKKMEWVGMTEDEAIESRSVSKTIANSQEKVEKRNFDVRKHLLDYDDVLNQHRKVIYGYRRNVLDGSDNIYGLVRDLIADSISDIVAHFCPQNTMTPAIYDQIINAVAGMTALKKADFAKEGLSQKNCEQLKTDLVNFLLLKYDIYRNAQDRAMIQDAEKWLMLETIDGAWKQHMINIDHLKEGISFRGWGQKNPLIEYKKEAFTMFEDMMRQIRWEIVHHIFHMNLDMFNKHEIEARREKELHEINLLSGQSEGPKGEPIKRDEDKIGRNDPCTCGSGKKYKKCCGVKR